jgi:hypothetical protein
LLMYSLMLTTATSSPTKEGGEIITDMHFIRELIQVFHDSGVFPKAIEDWDAKPRVRKVMSEIVWENSCYIKLRRKLTICHSPFF